MIEFKKLPKERNNECLDLVWQVFCEAESSIFTSEGALAYKETIDKTKERYCGS